MDDAEGEGHAQEATSSNVLVQRMMAEVDSAQQTTLISDLCKELNRSFASVARYMEATAEQCYREQQALLKQILQYIETLQPHLRAVIFVHRDALDETPLRLRVSHSAEDRGGVAEIAKVFVMRSSYSMLLKQRPLQRDLEDKEKSAEDYVVIQGAFSASLCAADAATGTAIAQITSRAPGPQDGLDAIFERRVRVVERDENPANMKGDRLFASTLGKWDTLMWMCSAHKTHTVAEKTIALHKTTLSGAINVLLSLSNAQQLSRFQQKLQEVVAQRLVVMPVSTLSREARCYRESVLKQYLPEQHHGKKRALALMVSAWFNGDWRNCRQVQHMCSGPRCCASPQNAIENARYIIARLLRSLRPTRLCRANWQEWRKPLYVLGWLLAMHGLLGDAFRAAFPAKSRAEEDTY